MTFIPISELIKGTSTHTHDHGRGKSKPNAGKIRSTVTRKPKKDKRGCEYCPLNEVHGLHKIKGKVRGKKIFIFAQSPGPQENKKKKELIGPSGKFLWYELKTQTGIIREDCDIQNVVRCMPADINKRVWPPLKMRTPNKQEIKACSIYNEQAIEKSQAKLYLIFGKIAATTILKREYKQDKRIFFSEHLKAWVVVLDHPSYFIHQGYSAGDGKAANDSLKRFRNDLRQAKQLLSKGKYDKYEFLKKQKYIGVTDQKHAKKVYRKLKDYALKHDTRLIVDMEEGKINEKGEPDEEGKNAALVCGFAAKPGTSYIFALEHPDAPISSGGRLFNREIVTKLLKYSHIRKAAHYLPSDTDSIKRVLGTRARGFDYDTLLAEYFKDPDAKSYGLDAISQRRYPEFQDYKSIEGPESFTPKFKKFLKEGKNPKKFAKHTLNQLVMLGRSKQGFLNLARMPWKKMVLYNGADCHLEKLVEQDTVKYVNQPLMQVYVDASYVLYRMERDKKCQPIFDYRWHKKVNKLWPKIVSKAAHKIRKYSGKYAYVPHRKTGKIIKKKFNPSSGDHILWLLYKKMRYIFPGEGKKDTRESTLLKLGAKHKLPHYILAYRKAKKAKGTYIDGFYKCANLNDGHLRTNWKMTGTGTGRFSSGKTKDKKNEGVVGFQNIHGNPFIKCLLISDKRWYKIYKYWLKHGDFNRKTWKKFGYIYVDLGFDFSQNELRQLAEESGDKNLIHAFSTSKKWFCKKCKTKHSADPHVEVGHELTGWSKERIAHDDQFRKLVKNMQFGLVFGLKDKGLYAFIVARGVKTSLTKVQRQHRRYFQKYPGVKRLQDKYRKFVEKNGFVANAFGFCRQLDVHKQSRNEEGEREGAWWGNQAINTPIQGASHQYLVMSVATLHRKPKTYKLLLNPNKEIHDALYFRVRLLDLFKAIDKGHDLMVKEPVNIVENDFHMEKKVPLSAKPKAGFRFGVQIEGLNDGINNEWDFLNAWCKENKLLEDKYKKDLAEIDS